MKPHLKSVVRDLIQTNSLLDDKWRRLHLDQEKLLREIQVELVLQVNQFDSKKLACIICAMSEEDTPITVAELLTQVKAQKIGEQFFREIVTAGLSYVMRDALNKRHSPIMHQAKAG
jgi:hypothetical protein